MKKLTYLSENDKKTLAALRGIAEKDGWEMEASNTLVGTIGLGSGFSSPKEGYLIELSKDSPAGQGFGISIELLPNNSIYRAQDSLERLYDDFDVSYETYNRTGSDGHGYGKAPYEIIDIYKDMQACREYISRLAEQIG